MIRIRLPAKETLEALIDRAVPAAGKKKSWRARAKAHTKKLKAQKEVRFHGCAGLGRDQKDLRGVAGREMRLLREISRGE